MGYNSACGKMTLTSKLRELIAWASEKYSSFAYHGNFEVIFISFSLIVVILSKLPLS